jgi:hypothetical protein
MMNDEKIISAASNRKYLRSPLTEAEIIDLLSDIKHRVFPRPFERLSKVRQGKKLVGAEIGVCGGEHALSLLENLDIAKLYLIDPYELYSAYKEGHAHYGVDQAPLDMSERQAKQLLQEHAQKIVWVKKLSADAAADISEQLDFVYVDGNHEESFVRDDINKYYGLLKSGGVLGGHDFYNGFQREHDGVINAVTDFSVGKKLTLQVEMPDWWMEKP